MKKQKETEHRNNRICHNRITSFTLYSPVNESGQKHIPKNLNACVTVAYKRIIITLICFG